jgi:hypothetical protein
MSKFTKWNPPPVWLSFTRLWGTSGGKFWKRRLHKVRRKVGKEEIRAELEEDRVHDRGLLGAEREVNWKGW